MGIKVLPETAIDIQLTEKWTQTLSGDNFLMDDLIMDNGKRCLIFASNKSLVALCSSKTLFMDGTFKASCKQFQQLYIIHGEISVYSEYVRLPLVFILLPDKRKETYIQVFTSISKNCLANGHVLNPMAIKIDFEIAVLKALEAVFMESKVTGCNFHFNQSLFRKVQHEGLVSEYRDNDEVQQHIRMAAALAHLPVDKVTDGWITIMEDCPLGNAKLDAWNDYFVNQWMENIDLPHSCWNVSQEEHRTNNTCEGYNNRLNKSISKIHPNVFELVAVLQKEESSVRVTLHQMEFGEPPKKRRRIYRNLNDKLKKVQLELTSGTRTMKSFLKVVGFLLKL